MLGAGRLSDRLRVEAAAAYATYVHDRYGSWDHAAAFWRSHRWY